ncbi:MAG: hypothetical protein LQ347_004987 [Umbilicaria vellea]|nr:MAG: hypothetical protein LQ347_004987 [Umbilicaria vellea]
MDGTIIDSTDAIVKHWHSVAKELGVDPNTILAASHGRRTIDVIKLYDESKANWDYVSQIEQIIPKKYAAEAVELPGSRELLSSLDEAKAPWSIVTSGTLGLVEAWFKVMGLPYPKKLVTAEDVKIGKPDPTCYRLGTERLGLDPQAAMLVLEDAPAGIRAGKAAGYKVVGLTTTHSIEQVKEAGADWILKDLSTVRYVGTDEKTGSVKIEISGALRS